MKRRTLLLESLAPLLALTAGLAHAQAPAPADDVEIEVESAPADAAVTTTPAAPLAPASQDELNALRAQLDALSTRLEASETARREEAERDATAHREAETREAEQERRSLLDRVAKLGVSLSGYVQAQYGRSQLSQDELLQGGTPLNQNRFSVRRGRVRLKGRWKYVRTDFELDASTTRGPSTSVRRASVSGVLPNPDATLPPYLLLTAGLTEIPLGVELQQGQDDILFLERTQGSLAFFAGPVDTGVRLDGSYGPLRASFAVMNGVPLDDRAGGPSAVDPTRAPDYVGRVGADARPHDKLRIAGGASFVTGKGFHPGSDATKSVLQWDDSNGDGAINAGELVAVAGRSALPSRTFKHWGVAADLAFELSTRAGLTRVYGEVMLGQNLDRALFVADPIAVGSDVRELSWYVAFIQDVTRWGFVGLRYDVYDPNSDLVDTRRGQSIPSDASLTTVSPIAGLRLPGYGRLTFEYDHVDDKLARDVRGVPTDVSNDQWTLRVQGEF